MLIKKSFLFPLIVSLFFLLLNTSPKAQELPDENNNATIVDSIDYSENLLDSNEIYKRQFDSLSKDGEWIKMNKAEFVRAVSAETGEDLESQYPQTTEVIYIWRPYCSENYWNPYSNGSWVFSNYGWVWQSNYNWGWGPYNYGRWYHSNLYGWTWIPGCRWAANWVTWRHYNQYVGWYPTCPGIYWNNYGNICTNNLFASSPLNWTIVKIEDFTKKIDNVTIVNTKYNAGILKNSEKIKTAIYVDPGMPKIKYSGPDVKEISDGTGEKISPKYINVPNHNETKYDEQEHTSAIEKRIGGPVNENNTKSKTGDRGYEQRTKEVKGGESNTKESKTSKDSDIKKTRQKQDSGTKTYKGSNDNNGMKTKSGSTESNSGKNNNGSKGTTKEEVKQESNGNSEQKGGNTKGSTSPGF